MNQYLISKLKEGRTNKGLKQSQVADIIGIKPNTLSGWENGVTEPDIDTFLELCRIYELDYASILEKAYDFKSPNIDFSLNQFEVNHIKKYRALDSYGKKQVDNVLQNEYDRVKEQSMEIAEETAPYMFTKTEYLTGLSAGTGLFVFDDVPTQTTDVPEKYKDADFVIGVSGDSMEPSFDDGDKVAVKKQPSVNVGEIGVFMINGDGYIKELGNNVLISHNKKYDDIIIDEDTLCIGKVLGKL